MHAYQRIRDWLRPRRMVPEGNGGTSPSSNYLPRIMTKKLTTTPKSASPSIRAALMSMSPWTVPATSG